MSRDRTDIAGPARLAIVDHATVSRAARQRIHAVRRRTATRDEAARVYARHGSGKGARRRTS